MPNPSTKERGLVALALSVEDVRLIHRAVATTVQLYDGVEEGGGVPRHAPLYGKRDRLLELARQLDHEANLAARYRALNSLTDQETETPDGA